MATHHSFSATLRLPAGSGSLSQPITAAPATAGGTQSLAPSTPDSPKLTRELLQRLKQLESENKRMKQGKYSASWGAGFALCGASRKRDAHQRGPCQLLNGAPAWLPRIPDAAWRRLLPCPAAQAAPAPLQRWAPAAART